MHEKYMLVNLQTIDHADMMIMDEEERNTSDHQYIEDLLREHSLTINSLEKSTATIHNVDKTLYIRFDQGTHPIFKVSLLERIDLRDYITFAKSYDHPHKVLVYDVSYQIGGIIDTNYGIKFKVQRSPEKSDPIYAEKHAVPAEEKDDNSAHIFLKTIHGIPANDASYDGSIKLAINSMYGFWREAMRQLHFVKKGGVLNPSGPLYTKGKEFALIKCNDQYCASAYFEDLNQYIIYMVKNKGEVEIIGTTHRIRSACIEFSNYLRGVLSL